MNLTNSQVSIIIPVYKKTDMFVANLKHNLPYLTDCEIIIANDDPETSIRAALAEFLTDPRITLIENEQNVGFGPNVNRATIVASGKHFFLLNTDVKLQDDSWKKALPKFSDDSSLFAVSFAQREKDGRIVGKNELYFFHGLFHHKAASDMTSGPTVYAEGGSSIFRASMWRELNGFDDRFAPFYWEDVDLSYRAHEKGWHVFFDSSVVVEHHHESSISSHFDKKSIAYIAYQHQLYFTRKHASLGQRLSYYFFLIKRSIFVRRF